MKKRIRTKAGLIEFFSLRKIKNWGGECRDVTPTKLKSKNIFKESTGGGVDLGGGGGSGWM